MSEKERVEVTQFFEDLRKWDMVLVKKHDLFPESSGDENTQEQFIGVENETVALGARQDAKLA